MNSLLYLAAALLILIGLAHSYLGERYILIRLFKRGNLPELLGGTEFTQRTLRFAWHLTSVAWFGFAAILFSMANAEVSNQSIGWIIGATFLLHCVIALVHSRAKHLSWIVFLVVGMISIIASSG